MVNQTKIESVLKDARWASRTLSSKHSDIKVHLTKFPSVVGGDFRAQVTGLSSENFGQANISITCTSIDSVSSIDEFDSVSQTTHFQEVESLAIDAYSFDIMFHIPFDAVATEEGAYWSLSIYFSNGLVESFEVPVCRTDESNTQLTSVQIAATGLNLKENHQKESQHASADSLIKTYTVTKSREEWQLKFPAHISGRIPVLAKGLGIFTALWFVMFLVTYWASKGALEPVVILGLPLLIMLAFIVFMFFGVTHCLINKEMLITKHKLFGLPLKWNKVMRSEIAGFSTLSLGVIQMQLNYMLIAKTKDESTVLFGLTVFNQKEARVIAKQLNEYWKIKK